MLDWFGRKLREMQEVKRDERGFTLIELLVVVIIIGILAAIAIPTFLSQRDSAQDADAVSAARNAATVIQAQSTAQGGEYAFADGWTEAELDDFESSLAGYTIAVFADADAYAVSVTSETGSFGVFDSTTGEATVEATAPTAAP